MERTISRWVLAFGIVVLCFGAGVALHDATATAADLPPAPANWPATMQLGMADGLGGAKQLKAKAPFGFRYQYLAGGVGGSGGWFSWNPNGGFVKDYVKESVDSGVVPVFTYYMLRQSAPNAKEPDDRADFDNLQDPKTMAAYWTDVKRFFVMAGMTQDRVILHIEPDFWGFMQKKARADDATTVPAKVGTRTLPDLIDLPDNLQGYAQAFARLRDTYAPNVLLAYHLSVWGTGDDILYTNPAKARLDALSQRTSDFYKSLATNFDIVFTDASDRDAGFKQANYKDNGTSWWDKDDYARNVSFLASFAQSTQKRIVLWQIPLGNTVMKAVNNTWNHYQDNHVETLLESKRVMLKQYADAGVIALLFGRGADGATCACDAAKDGETNPAPIASNDTTSLSADDDGGLFMSRAAAYYTEGPTPLSLLH